MSVRFAWLLMLVWALPATVAAREVGVVSEGDCPSVGQLTAALLRAAPDARIEAGRAAAQDALQLEVTDLGPRYRARVLGLGEREFDDPGRACEERARTAAVFASLAFELPAPGPPARARKPSPGSPIGPHEPLWLDLDAAALLALAPVAAPLPLTGGAALRLTLGRPRIGGALGLSVLAPATIPLDEARASLTRVQLDLQARARVDLGPTSLIAQGGLLFDLLVSRGTDLAAPRTDVGVSPGVTLGAALRYRLGRLAPFVCIDAALFPLPKEFVVQPSRTVGQAPWLWLSLGVGVSWSVLPATVHQAAGAIP